jgi:molybdopterin molybdotransferase
VDVPAVARGTYVRTAGHDTRAGEAVELSHEPLGPAGLAVLASLGLGSLAVRRRPRVAILSTGDELRAPGEELTPGQIHDANGPSLAAAVGEAGGEPMILPRAGDDARAIGKRMRAATRNAELLIVSGGVSVGRYDHVRSVIERLGRLDLWRIRVQPGKPLAFGAVDGLPILGLPGNPVSALVAFEQFGRPAIHKMMGRTPLPKPTVTAVLDDPVHNYDGRRVYARVVVYRSDDGTLRARSTGTQSSGALSSMAAANGLAICPDDVAKIDAGQKVTVEMLDWPEDVFSG